MMKKTPRPMVFLGPKGAYKHSLGYKLDEHKDTCDMAFISGTLVITPYEISGATRLQQWISRYCRWRKASWTGLLRTASHQFYSLQYQPDSQTLNFLKKMATLPIRFAYFWPLEVAQHILAKHPQVPWSLFWLPTPLGVVSLFAYHKDRPLFCRTLPHDATLSAEILPTQQYLKRFGYEQNTPLHVFTPDSLVPQIPDTSLTFQVYTQPVITRPIAPLFIQELSRNYWLARLPVALQWLLTLFILLSSYRVGQEAWQLRGLYHNYQQLQSVTLPLLSPTDKKLLDSLVPYGDFWKTATPTLLLLDYHVAISEKLTGNPLPQEITWHYLPSGDSFILEFAAGLSKTQKTTLSEAFKSLSFITTLAWKKNHLHLRLIQYDPFEK